MVWTARTKQLWRSLVRRRQLEAELDEELRACAALMEGEGMEQVKESVRDEYWGIRLESLWQDLRYAWRTLWKSPGFAAVALVTLVLGIGANTAIFSVVYAVLLRPLPYGQPEQLALIWSRFEKSGALHAPTSPIAYREIQHRSRLFQDVAAIWVGSGTFTGGPEPEQVKMASVTPNFLHLMGVRPALGRVFRPDEQFDYLGAIVLSYGLWQKRFGGDPQIVGKRVAMQGGSPIVLGVMPQGFQLYFSSESNVPMDAQAFMAFGPYMYEQPLTLYYLRLLARLKPGVGPLQAQEDLDGVASQMRAVYSKFADENMKLSLAPMQQDAVREIRPALLALFAGAGLVLLIACVNVANLLLERASGRRREMALRTALGAGRGRVLRQLFLEGLVLCGVGAVLGVGLGWAGVRALLSLRPNNLVQLENVGLHWPVLGFVAAVTLGSAMLFGLAPAWESTRLNLIETLREGGHAAAPAGRRVSAALIVCEVALGFVLVIGAGLMIRTLANIRAVHPGFEAQQVLTFRLGLPQRPFAAVSAWLKDWEAALCAMPGVQAVGGTSHIPLGDFANWYGPYQPEGVSENQAAGMIADERCVTPGFFHAMNTRLVEGRFFDEQDRADGRRVAVVDELLARSAWPGQSPLGKRIRAEHTGPNGFEPDWAVVVGVVEHVRNHSLSKQVRPEIYYPFEQSPRSPLAFAVRMTGDPLALAPAIRKELARRNPNLAISNVEAMTGYVESARAPANFTAVLAAIFAALALLLAAVGIYGVISYSVSRRSRELGVRMALGASSWEVMRMVQREGLTLMAVGLALGVAAALGASRWLEGLLYGVPAVDPLTYTVAFGAIAVATLIGCWRPAAKAARTNPMDAIRAE